jgi:hypothetical protein
LDGASRRLVFFVPLVLFVVKKAPATPPGLPVT